MDQIESVDANSSVATVQSGVILERLDSTLRSEHGLMVPLDLGAKGSCHIGGNVSTNAGGLRLVRYGNLHGSVMGVEAVLADGRVLDCLSPLKKGEFSQNYGTNQVKFLLFVVVIRGGFSLLILSRPFSAKILSENSLKG